MESLEKSWVKRTYLLLRDIIASNLTFFLEKIWPRPRLWPVCLCSNSVWSEYESERRKSLQPIEWGSDFGFHGSVPVEGRPSVYPRNASQSVAKSIRDTKVQIDSARNRGTAIWSGSLGKTDGLERSSGGTIHSLCVEKVYGISERRDRTVEPKAVGAWRISTVCVLQKYEGQIFHR